MRFKNIRQASFFNSDHDHRDNDIRRVEDVDHVIMKVTKVAQRLSQDSGHVENEIITTEQRGACDRLSFRSAGDTGCTNNDDETTDIDDQTDWYEVSLREGITVTKMLGGSIQAILFVKYAEVETDPSIRRDIISPVASPVICRNHAKGSAHNNEGSAVSTILSRDTDGGGLQVTAALRV